MSKSIQIPIDSGARTVAGLLDEAADPLAAFVFAHGAGAGMQHPFMAQVAQGLADRRVTTLRFQFPYMDAGGRRPDPPAVAHAAVRAAVASAQRLCGDCTLFAGGKSFGGRMTSQAQSIDPLPGVAGLMFLSFPLHPAAKPSSDRAAHLADVDVPLLFVHGARDALAEKRHFDPMLRMLRPMASVIEIADADHALHVPKRSGRDNAEVLDEILDRVVLWMMAVKAESRLDP